MVHPLPGPLFPRLGHSIPFRRTASSSYVRCRIRNMLPSYLCVFVMPERPPFPPDAPQNPNDLQRLSVPVCGAENANGLVVVSLHGRKTQNAHTSSCCQCVFVGSKPSPPPVRTCLRDPGANDPPSHRLTTSPSCRHMSGTSSPRFEILNSRITSLSCRPNTTVSFHAQN
jgi:hypothetical protein